MVAIYQDIEVEQYATFRLPVACFDRDPDTLQLVVRDLTGWTGAMQIRLTTESDDVLAEAEVDIDVATGVVTASIDDATTGAYTWRSGVYDLLITDGIEADRLARGNARLRPGTTRD
jgi:hypothetical protein